jgi:O-antigen biosynthesis protein
MSLTFSPIERARVHGRSVLVGGKKVHVRGVTYGTFGSIDGGSPFPPAERVRHDFEAMVAAGVNTVRTYLAPPLWMLDAAHDVGLRVMVGLAWEQHVAFLEEPHRAREIAARVARQVRDCEAHPAILCYAIGNEIPAAIVRWNGKRRTERFLEQLYWEAKAADPGGLFTYVNYPSTEYLELPFLDLTAFNVFLEDEATFESYLARLQNLSGDRPLLVTEVGLDSRRNGADAQARALEWQIRHAFATGAAGVFVFSWTDEWHRGGQEVTDWDFGLVDRRRRPKPSLEVVSRAFASSPFSLAEPWPKVSVIVCTHNGAGTLAQCLERTAELTYPDFEVIVVDDGSTDRSAEMARTHGATLIQTEHRGLSYARNAGVRHATGEIVAFLDDDAYPDADWLYYLAAGFRAERYAGVGGPNLPPDDERLVADCVAAAPGGPIHILVSDREAEHVPGCNMAFRKSALEQIGGFDERFRTAGDDVDVCWRLQKAGKTLGFSAGAVVMHRRRDSVRRYLKQQYGYGKAEALLERKWPSHYNRAGASRWSGRIYESPLGGNSRRRPLVRYGTWGTGLFQSIYDPPPGMLASLLRMPESLLVLGLLGAVSALGMLWRPLLVALVPLAAVLGWILVRAVTGGWNANPAVPGRSALETFQRRALTASLFLAQPFARLAGRLRNGLSPWRRRMRPGGAWPRPRKVELWSELWREPQARMAELHDALAIRGGFVRSGGPFDRWDLDLRTGPLGGVKIRVAVEEHGAGRQLLRARIWPRASAGSTLVALTLALIAGFAWHQGRADFGIAMGVAMALLLGLALEGTGTATGLAMAEIARLDGAPADRGPALSAPPQREHTPPATRLMPPAHKPVPRFGGALARPREEEEVHQ